MGQEWTYSPADEVILWEVNTSKLKKKQLYIAANEENFKKLFRAFNITHILYYCDLEGGRAEFCDVYQTTRVALFRDRHNITRIGRVHELYIDSDCEVYSSLVLYVPLCSLPGAKPFKLIDTSEYEVFRVGPLSDANLPAYDKDDPFIGVF